MGTKTKKVVEKTPTLTQSLQNSINRLEREKNQLQLEHEGLKKSFYMIKDNYEREKTRLDKVIDSLLNHSKTN